MKNRIIILLTFLNLLFPKDAVEIKINKPGHLVIEVTIDSVWVSHSDGIIHTKPNLNTFLKPSSPIIPFWEDIFIGLPANADVKVYQNDIEEVGYYEPIIGESEKAKGIDFELPLLKQFNGVFPHQNVNLTQVNKINKQPTTKVEIFPISIRENKLFFITSFSVHISWKIDSPYNLAKQLSKVSSANYFQKDKLSKVESNVIPEYQFYQNIAKITVDSSAWYKITNIELLSNNINLSNVDIRSVRLWNRDKEIRLLIESEDDVFNDEDEIIFFGEKNPPPEWADYDNNFYTNNNIYWLTWGTGVRLQFDILEVEPILPSDEVNKPSYFIDKKKIEKDEIYEKIGSNNQYIFKTWDTIDHFFMNPKIIVSGPFDFDFELDSPYLLNNQNINLEIQVRGMTILDHELDIYLNRNLVNTAKWSGQNANTIKIDNIDNSILKDGLNTFSINLSPNDSTAHDLVYINWYEIEYPKRFITKSNYIKFIHYVTSEKKNEFEIKGFTNSDIYIFKDQKYKLTNFNLGNDYTVIFQDDDGSSVLAYEVFTKNEILPVKSLSLENSFSNILQNITNEYIIIAPDTFFTVLEPLSNYHNGKIVDINQIYRQYSHGVLSPYAIKSFLEEIYRNNDKKLKYVLFTMSADSKDFWGRKFARIPSFIPAMFVYTYQMGVVACDYWFGSFDDEFWIPNISIGRFPINTKSELQNIVDKTMFHHNRNISNWDNDNLLIGGSDIGFKHQSESLVNNIKNSGAFLSRLYVAQTKQDSIFYGNADTLASHFSNGLAYINFFGHGGGRVWEDNGLLTYANIKNLNNKFKYPFISSMSCHTGDISYSRILSRQMVEKADGGAIAWYAASGLGWSYNDYYLTIPMQELLFSNEDLTIGEIINLSKTKYYLAYSSIYPEIAGSQLYQYNLIGDPALKLKKPIKDIVNISPLDPEPGEDIEISSNISQSDSVLYQIFLPDNYSLNQSTLLENSLPTEIALPDTFRKGIHNINVSFKSNEKLYNSSQLLSVAGSYVNIQSIVPSTPTICDSIGVIAEASDRNGISSVKLILNDEYWADMINIDSSYYSLEKLIPPQPSGTMLNLICQVIDTNNDTTFSLPKNVNISDIPNIVPLNGKFRVDDEINLVVEIESTTTTPVSANVELFINNDDKWELIGKDTVNFIGMEIKEAILPGYYRFGTNQYKVVTNANLTCMSTDLVTDDTLAFDLETNAFWVTPELGSTDNGTSHSKIGINFVEIDIHSGLVTESSILQILSLSDVIIPFQPDFEVIQSQQNYNGIDIIWETTSDYAIKWTIGELAVQSNNKLYRYFEEFRNWLPVTYTEISDSTINFVSGGSAKFAFLENTDVEKPTIIATVNDQQFLRNNYLNTNPSIQLIIYDKNGTDHRSDSVFYWINNNISDLHSEINGSGNSINIIINPTFANLDSTLSVLVQDAAGNSSDTLQLSFIVSEKLDLIDYGNYPNPFAESTVFAYELTDAVEKFTFTIYTVEGRKIRRLDNDAIISGANINLPGYHEIEWDGKNQDGIQIGNGNYFYQIRAKNNKTVLERTGKILKVK